MLLQVVVSYTKQQKYHHLTTSLKKLGRNIGRGNRKSIATAAVANKTLRPALVHRLSQELRKNELKSVCSDDHDSILRLKSKPAMENYTWDRVWEELQHTTQLLLSCLQSLSPPSKQDIEGVKPALCVCTSILLKLNNQKVNLVQSVISLILKAGHATKQVSFTFLLFLTTCCVYVLILSL